MEKQQIKLFQGNNAERLEDAVNAWLEEQAAEIEVLVIEHSQSMAQLRSGDQLSIMIMVHYVELGE